MKNPTANMPEEPIFVATQPEDCPRNTQKTRKMVLFDWYNPCDLGFFGFIFRVFRVFRGLSSYLFFYQK